MITSSPAVFITASIFNYISLLKGDSFKEIILSSIKYLNDRNLLTVYAFVIMPNHVHFIWRESITHNKNSEAPKAAFFKYTAHQFLKVLRKEKPTLLNRFKVNKSDRSHRFWQRNPMEIEIFTDKVFEQKLNYIHNNPIQQKWQLVESSIDYKYSSIRFYENNLDEFEFLTNYFFER